MDLTVQPDLYAPSIDDDGNYIDKIPSFNIVKKGLYCSCGSRKDKIYDSSSKFGNHIKTKIHTKWLLDLNLNKSNYYIQTLKDKDLINNQKLIIARMELNILNKERTIEYLTDQLQKPSFNKVKVENLIDLN